MNTDKISIVLWQLDPMRTGCTGDEAMRDEYEFQAEEIASLISDGIPIRTAIVQVFEKWFWEDEYEAIRSDKLAAAGLAE